MESVRFSRGAKIDHWRSLGRKKFAAWLGLAGEGQAGPEAGIIGAGSAFPRWKRVLDLACVLLSLPAWLPLMAVIAAVIKLVSRGPVFFCQERIGLGGRPFACLKFRSMRVNAGTAVHENYLRELIRSDRPMTKLDAHSDHRLIPSGRFFRATGLDELPQLFNVLRGEMSLVGPRPCTAGEFECYEPWQKKRADAPPGLTGYWQVNGKNGTTFREMISMDIWYAGHMSLPLDLGIMLRTPGAIFRQVFETRATRCSVPKSGDGGGL